VQLNPNPKAGPGGYLDDFLVRRVEGGFLLVIEHTEVLEQPAELPPGMPPNAPAPRMKHVRQVVAKSVSEIVVELRRWTETDVELGSRARGEGA
jgi:hypothetical protein